jgi:hypothetical protein
MRACMLEVLGACKNRARSRPRDEREVERGMQKRPVSFGRATSSVLLRKMFPIVCAVQYSTELYRVVLYFSYSSAK